MKDYVLSFDQWLKESMMIEDSVKNYKKRNKIKFWLDEALEINESTNEYFNQSNKYKNNLDNLITKKIIDYVNVDGKINEGFWTDLASKAKEIGGKAVDAAKKIIGKIGEIINNIKFFLKRVFNILIHSGKELVIEQKEMIFGDKQKEAFKEKMAKEEGDKDKIKQEADLVKEHAKYTFSNKPFEKEFDNQANEKVNDIKTTIEKDEEGNKDDADKAIKDIGVKESFIDILSLFKDNNILEKILNNDKILFEKDEEDIKPTKLNDQTIQTNKLFVVINKIVDYLTSSILNYFETFIKSASKELFNSWTSWNNKRGGPQASKMPILSTAISGSIILLLEQLTVLFKKILETTKLGAALDVIYYSIHLASVMGIINIILYTLLHNKTVYFVLFGIGLITSTIFLMQELGIMPEDNIKEILAIKSPDHEVVTKLVQAI